MRKKNKEIDIRISRISSLRSLCRFVQYLCECLNLRVFGRKLLSAWQLNVICDKSIMWPENCEEKKHNYMIQAMLIKNQIQFSTFICLFRKYSVEFSACWYSKYILKLLLVCLNVNTYSGYKTISKCCQWCISRCYFSLIVLVKFVIIKTLFLYLHLFLV